ncbi:beta-crystallin A3 isoform 2-T2 [Rhynchonycteris naso]
METQAVQRELETLSNTKMAQTNPMPGSVGPWKITIYDQENFQGKRMEFTSSCPNVSERSFDNVRSLKVECGAIIRNPRLPSLRKRTLLDANGRSVMITPPCKPWVGSTTKSVP